MTQLGLSWLAHKENERHNQAMEAETERSNRRREAQNAASLAETARANRKHEDLTDFDNRRKAQMDAWNRIVENEKLDSQIEQLKNDSRLKALGADKAAVELTRLLPQIDAAIINSIVSTLFKSGFSATGMNLIEEYLKNYTDKDGNKPFSGVDFYDATAAATDSARKAGNNVAKILGGLSLLGGAMLGGAGGATIAERLNLRNSSLF